MPSINSKVQLPPVSEDRKAITSCPPASGKSIGDIESQLVPMELSDKSGKLEQAMKDSSKIQSGAQGKAQAQLSLDAEELGELKQMTPVQGELQKLKQNHNHQHLESTLKPLNKELSHKGGKLEQLLRHHDDTLNQKLKAEKMPNSLPNDLKAEKLNQFQQDQHAKLKQELMQELK